MQSIATLGCKSLTMYSVETFKNNDYFASNSGKSPGSDTISKYETDMGKFATTRIWISPYMRVPFDLKNQIRIKFWNPSVLQNRKIFWRYSRIKTPKKMFRLPF